MRPWIDVVSKCDLLYTLEGISFGDTSPTSKMSIEIDPALVAFEGLGLPNASSIEHLFPVGHVKVSMKNGMNKLELQVKIKTIVKDLLKKMNKHEED